MSELDTELEVDELVRALGETTRLRITVRLAAEGELCVCELVHALQASQPKISRHLAVLRGAGLVSDRRDGTWIHYRLRDGLPPWAAQLVSALVEGTEDRPPYREDRERLAAMANRPGGRCAALGVMSR